MRMLPGRDWQLGMIAVVLPVYSFQLQTDYPIGNTFVWWGFMLATLWILWSLRPAKDSGDQSRKHLWAVHAYLLWNAFSILRGCFVAETYWDWKGLFNNALSLLLPVAAYLGMNSDALKSFVSSHVKYALPLFLLWGPLMWKDAFGFYLAFVPLILLAFPYLSFRWKALMVSLSVIVLSADLSARSNVVKFVLPFAMLPYYAARWVVPKSVLETARLVLFAAPAVLFALGVSGTFNVFKMNEYIKGDYVEVRQDSKGEVIEDDLKSDTRTFLYEEVLETAQKHGTWWLGRSPARGNETTWFADLADLTGRPERLTNEVAILNIFTWTGTIAVVLYGLVFLHAGWLGLMRSNNSYMQVLGLFVTFRWFYAWIEDINIFNMNYFAIWVMIGMCLSDSFRKMDDSEMRQWFVDLFTFKPSEKAVQ